MMFECNISEPVSVRMIRRSFFQITTAGRSVSLIWQIFFMPDGLHEVAPVGFEPSPRIKLNVTLSAQC